MDAGSEAGPPAVPGSPSQEPDPAANDAAAGEGATASNPFDDTAPEVAAPNPSDGAAPFDDAAPEAAAPNPFDGVAPEAPEAHRPSSSPEVALHPMGEKGADASASAPPPVGAFPTPVKQAATLPLIPQSEVAKLAAQGMFQAGKEEAEKWARNVPCRLLMVGLPALLMLIVVVPCSSGGCMWLNPRPRTITGLLWTVILPLAPFVHTSLTYLWIDLTGWVCLGWRLSGHGAGTFVSLSLTLVFFPALLTWVTGSSGGLYTGMAGILFGIFGFNTSLLPVKYRLNTLTREDVVGFIIFDILFGGIWWCFSYILPPYTWVLAMWGLCCGVLFSVSSHGGEKIDSERIPLLVRTERCVEAKTGPYIDRLCV